MDVFAVPSPKLGKKGNLDPQALYDDLRRKPSLLVVWPSGHPVPREVALAAGRIVDVGPVRAWHIVTASK